MKKAFYAAFIAGSFLFFSCGDNSGGSQDKVESSTDTSGMTGSSDTLNTTNNMSGDTGRNAMNNTTTGPVNDQAVTSFVQKAISGGMMEVELGNIASSKAQNPRVKNFAAMMVADHSAAGNELKQMASANNITAPTQMLPEHKGHIDMMKNKSGAAFDKAYMDMMVKDHKKDLEEYKKAANNLAVPQYKAFAGKTVPVLQKHMDSAQAIHKSM